MRRPRRRSTAPAELTHPDSRDPIGRRPTAPPCSGHTVPMRFVIVGAGAIGGVVGARLSLSGHDVVLVARVHTPT